MNYIVFDLEWNQSPEGKEASIAHLPFEIIEIGAVKLDGQCRLLGEFHRLIRPQIYKSMHFRISEVTHMDMEELRHEGMDFPRAMEEFLDWCGPEEYRFCTWGCMDLTELQRNMAYFQVKTPFTGPLLYYDVQKLYSLQYGDKRTRISLDQAVMEQALQTDRPFHRALDDAFYTGGILGALDMERFGIYISVDYYILPDKGENYRLYFPEYLKLVSGEFESREELLADKNITDMICVKCNRMLRKKIRWFPWGQRFYLCLAICPEHGYVRGKLRVKKSEHDSCFVVKTIKAATKEEAETLVQKKEDGKHKKKSLPGNTGRP